MPEPTKGTGTLTGGDLSRLLSKQTYGQFNAGGGSHGSTSCPWLEDKETEVKSILEDRGILENRGDAEDYAKKIIGAYCDASTMDGKKPYGTWCQFFYYWLGDLLSNQLHVASPFDTLKKIYEELENVSVQGACKNINENINEEIFPQVKIHFDYKQDYETLQSQLGNGVSGVVVVSDGGTKTCDSTYHKHLEAITKACEAVVADCGERGPKKSGSYCGPLQAAAAASTDGAAGEYCSTEKLDILTCKEVRSKPQVEEPVAHSAAGIAGSTPAAGNHVTAPIVSSTLSILGLPAAAFFLYKYTSLPSWIRNNIFGINNRKRRRSIGRNLDTEMKNFTDYSTEYTTDSSTIADSMTEEESIIYNRRPLPRRAGNDNARQKRNVAYHRI
ncbi:KIR protein [Plasmodium coatneyi]|uniref:KIR protein n=1 Tax=Plasmodium coatneyi TaxID=208452 RepID=A0A1B1DWD3_9APIC|nr:KIR protein [Plasmodium coatneyi]ANQ06895.1 KIR protein [Plasmodium coatneyi]